MVHNITRYAKLPFSNTQVSRGSTRSIGQGMGSVLLNKGGGGSASSYLDIDDYIHQTGLDPYNRQSKSSGQGMKSISDKLSKLSLDSGIKKKIKKNITMSI